MGARGEDAEAGSELPIVGEIYCIPQERHLTVRKTSLFSQGDGFAVYDHPHHTHPSPTNEDGDNEVEHEEAGEIVFRVETYGPDPHHHSSTHELVLMDPDGNCILTVRRKRRSLHQRWEGFMGERKEGQGPLFSMRRSSMIRRDSGGAGIVVEVCDDRGLEYLVEGSFPQRCCTVYAGGGGAEREVVAEMRRKVDASAAHLVLGRDVFCLRLKPGFDAAFTMGVVLVLDQITGDADGDSGAAGNEEVDL